MTPGSVSSPVREVGGALGRLETEGHESVLAACLPDALRSRAATVGV